MSIRNVWHLFKKRGTEPAVRVRCLGGCAVSCPHRRAQRAQGPGALKPASFSIQLQRPLHRHHLTDTIFPRPFSRVSRARPPRSSECSGALLRCVNKYKNPEAEGTKIYIQLGLFISVYLSVPFPSPLLASVVCAAAPISPPSPISGPSLT